MLGSLSEADDAVQETWLRLSRLDTGGVENLGGWLTTVVARVCLDMLRSRRSRREESLDAQVSEPAAGGSEALDPEHEVLLADSVGLALLVVLEMLAPAERVAFVLHDMFDLPFDEIAPVVGRSPAAATQLASRARRRCRERPPFPTPISPAAEQSSTPSSLPPRTSASSTWRSSPEAGAVFVSSAVALAAVPSYAVYAATKAAVHSLTRSLRTELASSRIRVFEVLSPVVDTGRLASRSPS